LDILVLSFFFSCSLAACLSIIYVFIFQTFHDIGKACSLQVCRRITRVAAAKLKSLPADKLVKSLLIFFYKIHTLDPKKLKSV
jgi:hypothetical protein